MRILSRERLTKLLPVAVVVAALALAGCGGGDDEEGAEISGVIATALTTVDAQEKCTVLVTAEFVTAVYGDEGTCLEAEADPDEDDKPDEVTVTGIEVDGDTATATLTETGGNTDGATGTISLTRIDGEWRISELGIDYLRSVLEQGFANADGDEEEMGPLADQEVADCFLEGMQALDDEEFRQIAYESMADRDPNTTFVEILTGCLADSGVETEAGNGGPGGESSLLRQQFEQGIRESGLADDATPQQINCVIAELRQTVTDQEIIDQVGMGEEINPALARKAAVAISNC